MFIECCSDNIERTEASFFHFVVPFSHRKSCSILNSIFEKIILKECESPYAVFKSGYSLNRISALLLCDSVHFSPDLNRRYLLLASNSFLVSPFSYRKGTYSRPSSFAFSMSSLASCIASQRCLMRISCTKIASKFLYVKSIYYSHCFGKACANNLSHGV